MSIFAPSNFTEGGGLLDDVDGTIKEMRVVLWDYNGKVAAPSPAFRALIEVDGIEGEVE